MTLLVLAAWCALADSGANPWGTGPDAPPADESAPIPTAPREPGADPDLLDVPARPPEPARAPLVLGLLPPARDERLVTERSRGALLDAGALDLDSALVGTPGLWLVHQQAGAARLTTRGLDDRRVAVVLDGVPLFDLTGLLPPLEQLSLPGSARLSFAHGARARSALGGVAGGVLTVESGAPPEDVGETLRMHGALAAGYGGADLEKGVLAFGDTGLHRARAGLHAALLNREDQRLGRAPGLDAPGGVLTRSGGSGGAVGARVDVSPWPGMRVFSSWHSARALSTSRPPGCADSTTDERARDCVTTLERGLDAWIAGGDGAWTLAGATLGVALRTHAQHGIAVDERAGANLNFVERAHDEGARAGAGLALAARLPALALWEVVEPSAALTFDGFGDVLSSRYARRSIRQRDAEPPGEGIEDPVRARRVDGAAVRHGAVGLELRADGARASSWAAASVALESVSAPALTGRFDAPLDAGYAAPSGEVGARARLVQGLDVVVVLTHVQQAHDPMALLTGPELGAATVLPQRPDAPGFVDDALELSLAWRGAFADVALVAWGAQRAGGLVIDVDPNDADTFGEAPRLLPGPVQTARGVEARGALRPGPAGLAADATFGVVDLDDGALLQERAPTSGTPNAQGTLGAAWSPPDLPFGVRARARFLVPQQRLSPVEERDPVLCPERPSDDDLAAGAVQEQPCRGAGGAFLFDLGAHLDVGAFRVDAMIENLLDQEGALRDEAIGFGGAAGRVLVTLRL